MNISDKLFVLQDCHLGKIMHLIQSVCSCIRNSAVVKLSFSVFMGIWDD